MSLDLSPGLSEIRAPSLTRRGLRFLSVPYLPRVKKLVRDGYASLIQTSISPCSLLPHKAYGTAFTVVVVSVFVFAAVGNPDLWLRVVSRIVLIPAIASIAYEVIRLGGAFASNPVTKVLMWPHLALQSITITHPNDEQVEVAPRAPQDMPAAARPA